MPYTIIMEYKMITIHLFCIDQLMILLINNRLSIINLLTGSLDTLIVSAYFT